MHFTAESHEFKVLFGRPLSLSECVMGFGYSHRSVFKNSVTSGETYQLPDCTSADLPVGLWSHEMVSVDGVLESETGKEGGSSEV